MTRRELMATAAAPAVSTVAASCPTAPVQKIGKRWAVTFGLPGGLYGDCWFGAETIDLLGCNVQEVEAKAESVLEHRLRKRCPGAFVLCISCLGEMP